MRIFRWGCLVAVLISAVCIGAVVLTVYRPTRVIGIDRDALATSLESELDGRDARCRRVLGAGEHAYGCEVETEGSGPRGTDGASYNLKVSDWGCWETVGGGRQRLDDCVWLLDYTGTSGL